MTRIVKNFIYISVLLAALSSVACDSILRYQPRRIYFFSPDKKHAFTVMENLELDYRYIVNGRVSHYPPDSNYEKLDIGKIKDLGDEVYMCWDEGDLEWIVTVPNTSIVEHKLDMTRFRIHTLTVDSLGTTTESTIENCAVFSYYTKTLYSNNGGGIVEFHHK